MAIVIAARPIGVKIIPSSNTATVSDSSGALFPNGSHGLVDGDYIYVDSDIEDYNGFWYVDQQDTNTFKLRESVSGGEILAFVVTGTITYYRGYTHNWSCVHLPITYKLDNNRFPVNTSDGTRSIVSHSDDSDFTSLTVSATLTISNTDFSHVKIVGAGSIDGVYRVLEKNGSYTQITIDLPYDVSNDFSSATVVIYYNNYATNVEVWAGLADDHPFASLKPYELLATLRLTPDENGVCFFSINELLKQKITPDNNPLLASAPNNINSFTQFYIKYYETYDYLTIYDLIDTKTGSTTDDSTEFEGVAVDAELPFKNQYSGHMSENIYTAAPVYTDDLLGKFLTTFTIPIGWPGQYFDLSFIKPRLGDVIVTVNGVQTIYTDAGIGVYRIPIEITGEELCVKITAAAYESEPPPNPSFAALSAFENQGAGVAWSTGANPSVTLDNGETAQNLRGAITDPQPDIEYTIDYDVDVASLVGVDAFILRILLYDSTMTTFEQLGTSENLSTNGNHTGSKQDTPSFTPAYVVFEVVKSGVGSDTGTLDINSYSGSATSVPGVSLSQAEIIEELCIEVNNECCDEEIVLVWKNYLGGYDRWKFCGTKEHQIDVKEVTEQSKNILPNWPRSYGERAHTIRRHTRRSSSKKVIFRSQNLTEDQRDALQYIKVSPLVQIEVSKRDRTTILIDEDSFKVYDEKEKLYSITFTGEYTNFLPSQKC